MALLVPLLLGTTAITILLVMSWVSAHQKRKAAIQRPLHAARVLIHDINDDRCTGCDACVAVCPTNVLDLIRNKSRVIRFQDCIQCEACMWACPTEALVMHPEGTEPPPLIVPALDGNYMTAVPGQYLIGEVAGKPLVKNAANIGRGVVEHMLRDGLRPGPRRRAEGSDSHAVSSVDVCIVGSGPGGLSAALTCIQRGLSYVVLDKEQIVASTVARYPKGKLIMAEPYDCHNLSLLPVFDSTKEQLIAVWEQLIQHTGLNVKLGEAVEKVQRTADGSFDIRTTVAAYRAQRVVLATGLRGKPRTLGVPGENLRSVLSLLEDPSDWSGKAVTVIGGGDSALEAAMALADSGAKVLLSYRGRSFSRAQNKNKQAVASYAAQRRIKVKFQTQIAEFTEDAVTLRFHDGSHKRYPNAASFVLIGADPPVKWLEKLGVNFVQRPHTYQLGPTDGFASQYAPDAAPCPDDAANAAAQVRGEPVQPHRDHRGRTSAQIDPRGASPAFPRLIESGRKWIQSASQIFTSARNLDRPMPLAEFAARQRKHNGRGRRDALDASERTRVLRMLRDDGARLADEDSRVYTIEEASGLELGFNEPSPVPDLDQSSPFSKGSPPPMHLEPNQPQIACKTARPLGTPREAIIVGLAKAKQVSGRHRRPTPPRRDPGFHQAPTHLNDLSALDGHNGYNGSHTATQEDPTTLARPAGAGPTPPQRYAADELEEATRAVNIDPGAIMAAVERPDGLRVPSVSSVIIEDDATEFMDMSRLPDISSRRPSSRPEFRPAHTMSDVDFDFDE